MPVEWPIPNTEFITGSNARMLSHDIQSTLGGRYIPVDVYPFDFQKCRQLLIITRDTERMLEISSKKIEVVPVWKWLLNL